MANVNAQGSDDEAFRKVLELAGQTHLSDHAAGLKPPLQEAFVRQLKEIDWPLVRQLIDRAVSSGADDAAQATAEARRAHPPEQLVLQPTTDADHARWNEAQRVGLDLLRSGKVAAVVVAGGQGTRLGFDLPKGMFPIGTVSGHSLFRIFCEQIQARSRQVQRSIPYGIMTSDATHRATVNYFEQHRHFGLSAADLRFFQQGNMPAVDAVTGRALLCGAGQLALSPDGHGGMLRALVSSGLIDEWANRGVETLFYHQVDNPTTLVCDPGFLGWHALHQADVSTKVAAKRSADEKMGIAVSVDGASKVIEYSDLPAEIAAQTDAQGQLLLWAGNTAIHAFQLDFLRRMAVDGRAFPFHIARKVVPYLDAAGQIVTPDKPNAFKFEQFVFDLLPAAQRSLIVQADRGAEFNPVKNKDGSDSPKTCREAMQTLHRRWLRAAGAEIGDDVPIEISPLFALDVDQLTQRITAGQIFDQPTFLTTDH